MDIEAEMRRPGYESAQFSRSVMSDSLQPHGLQHTRLPLSITNSWSLLRLKSIESVMPSNCLIFYHPLHLLSSIFPSIRVFSNESVLQIRWPKYWSFSLNTVTKEYLVRVYYAYKSSSRTGRFKIQRLM